MSSGWAHGFMDLKIKIGYSNQTNSGLVGLVQIGPELSKKPKKLDWVGLVWFGFTGYPDPWTPLPSTKHVWKGETNF